MSNQIVDDNPVRKSLDAMYKLGLDHAIDVAERYLTEHDAIVNYIVEKIVADLKSLKKQQ